MKFKDILEGLGNRNSAASRIGTQMKQYWQKKEEDKYKKEAKNSSKALGNLKAKIDFKFWEYIINKPQTPGNRQLADLLNDVLKTAQNKNGKMKIIREEGNNYIFLMKRMEIIVPKEFVTITNKK